MNKIFGQDPHIARVQRSYAEAKLSRLAEGADNFVDTVASVELARTRDFEKARSLQVRMLKIARARAISTLLDNATLTPGQSLLLEEALDLFDQIPSKDGIVRINDYRKADEKPRVRIGEHATAFPDIGYASYMLTLQGQTERPEDGEFAIVGRPTLTLSDSVSDNRDRHVGILFSEGTYSANTVAGIVVASTLGSYNDNGYNPLYTVPEVAPPTVADDYASLVAATKDTLAA